MQFMQGTLGLLYDIDPLLESAKQLQSKNPELKLLITGGGPRAVDINRFISKQQLE